MSSRWHEIAPRTTPSISALLGRGSRAIIRRVRQHPCLAFWCGARRQAPRCAMALNGCYNEPWPSAANNSLVNRPARPKPAYAAVREACRPVLASARIPRFQWRSHELFTAEFWLLSDAPEPQPAGELVAWPEVDGRREELLRWAFPATRALNT